MKKKGIDNHKEKCDIHRQKRIGEQNKRMSYIILYLSVFLFIIVGELILFLFRPNTSVWDLLIDALGNLMGVLAAFVLFDIVHEKLSKDSYAAEVSEQILETLMYHPETIELYENEQKKIFVNSFIGSIVKDENVSDMINNHLNSYLLTQEDYNTRSLMERDCRIRTSFSYRFVLETERTNAFSILRANVNKDPYFYVQEELNFSVKYLSPKGNNTNTSYVRIGLIYDNAALDKFLRGNKTEQNNEILRSCIFRENLDIEEKDKMLFRELSSDKLKLMEVARKMFRPHLTIDCFRGELTDVSIGSDQGRDYGLIFTFEVGHNTESMKHDIAMVFHIPKKWDSVLEIVLVEPTKDPKISISYNEDLMNVEMFSFLNKGESSSYENTLEDENGVYSIMLSNEWVFPISGAVFFVKRKNDCLETEDS